MRMAAPPKIGRIILKGDAYRALIHRVMTRDRWRCRRCESRQHLDPEHIISRSKVRLDVEWNLVTLCRTCHSMIHAGTIVIIGIDEHGNECDPDANKTIAFRYTQSS